jgi:hypothetical protein
VYQKTVFITILLFTFISVYPQRALGSKSTSVDLFRLTSGPQREDWPVINNNKILWIDSNGDVKGWDIKKKIEDSFFGDQHPLSDLFGLVGYDGRYLVYNKYTDANSYDVSIYDVNKK